MSTLPLVSIIIPCYNAEKWVEQAIESAINQTWENKEVIVIDDGSTDGSLDVIRQYEARICWETGENRGGSAARNRGLEIARGKYIQFLDADDILPLDKIETQMQLLQKANDKAIACCPVMYFKNNNLNELHAPVRVAHMRSHDRGIDMLVEMWLIGGAVIPHSWLCSRALIDISGKWDESLKADQDGNFFGRVLLNASRVFFTEKTKVFYRNPGGENVSKICNRGTVESRIKATEELAGRLLGRRTDILCRQAVRNRWYATALYYLSDYSLGYALIGVSKGLSARGGRRRMYVGGRIFQALYLLFGIKCAVVFRWMLRKLKILAKK